MAKKKLILDLENDDILLDKKAKRKLAKAQQQARKNADQVAVANTADSQPIQEDTSASLQIEEEDAMTRIAELCQEEKWRKAAVICLQEIKKQQDAGTPENAIGVEMAFKKIDKSLRRRMVAAFINESKNLLKKEYLLDV